MTTEARVREIIREELDAAPERHCTPNRGQVYNHAAIQPLGGKQ